MLRKFFFVTNILFLMLIVFPASGIFGLFNSQAASANNSFSTAAVFPMPTPSPTPTLSPSPTANPSGIPSATPSPTSAPQFDFPACPKTPGGDVNGKPWDVGYDVGEHWIIDQGMKHGSDYVYYLDGTKKALQCFYPIPLSEDGVQTNWLRKDKKGDNPGWPSYPNGADFGLNKGTYFYKNSLIIVSQPSPTPSATPSPTESPSSEASSSAEINS